MKRSRKEPPLPADALVGKCDFCGRRLITAPHRYDGEEFKRWSLTLCRLCAAACRVEIHPMYRDTFRAHLQKHGIAYPDTEFKRL